MTFIVTTHRGPHGLLVVIVDKDILGQVFHEDNLELSIKGTFFQGEDQTKDEVLLLLKAARHLHLTGKKTIELALNLDLVNPERILWVQGVPHAQIFSEG